MHCRRFSSAACSADIGLSLIFFPNEGAYHHATGHIRIGDWRGRDEQFVAIHSPPPNLLRIDPSGIPSNIDFRNELVAFDRPFPGIGNQRAVGSGLFLRRLRSLASIRSDKGKEAPSWSKTDEAFGTFAVNIVALLRLNILGEERDKFPVAQEFFICAGGRTENQDEDKK